MTSQSTEGLEFSDIEMLDAKMASALKRISSNQHFRRRTTCRRAACSKTRQISTRKICDHFRATGAYHAAQDPLDLFNVSLKWEDIQDFDARWDQALVSASEIPTENILEGLYNLKIPESVQFQTVFRNVRHEDYGKKTHWSDDQDAQLQSPEWKEWDRSISRQSKRKESLRWEESGTMPSVESNWTVFKRRLL